MVVLLLYIRGVAFVCFDFWFHCCFCVICDDVCCFALFVFVIGVKVVVLFFAFYLRKH